MSYEIQRTVKEKQDRQTKDRESHKAPL